MNISYASLSLDQLISWRDVASWTFWRKSIRSSASLPAWVVVMSIQSFMSCSHLLVGLPLPLLPSILASKMCLSSVSWRLMWPKYLSFSAFAFCRSIVVFISNLESTSLLVIFFHPGYSQDFSVTFHFKRCYPFCICVVYGPCFTPIQGSWEYHCL